MVKCGAEMMPRNFVKPNENNEFECRSCKEWKVKSKMRSSKKNIYGVESICKRCEGFKQTEYRAKAKELKNLRFGSRFPNIQPGVKLSCE